MYLIRKSYKPHFKDEVTCTEKLNTFHKDVRATICDRSGLSGCELTLYYNFAIPSHWQNQQKYPSKTEYAKKVTQQ